MRAAHATAWSGPLARPFRANDEILARALREHARLDDAAGAVADITGWHDAGGPGPHLESALRALRDNLQAHAWKQVTVLSPALEAESPWAVEALNEVRWRHGLLDQRFAKLQALVLPLLLGQRDGAARRRARRAALALCRELRTLERTEHSDRQAALVRCLSEGAAARVLARFDEADARADAKLTALW